MGRFFIILGILLMIAGFVMPFLGMGNLFSSLQPMLDLATDPEARASELCEEGETLDEVTGASTYTQGMGYASSVQMYCVDAEGNRREVSEEFVNSMFGDSNLFGNVGDLISQSFLFMGLSCVGSVLLFVGILMSVGAKRKNMMVYTSGTPITFGQNPNFPNTMTTGGSANMGGLSQQLKELEEAYRNNLINREEYEDGRKRILESMK